jgi:FkbM family methyltransferase
MSVPEIEERPSEVNTSHSSTRVRSEAGDPIQLSDLHPVACESLARVGNANDGGYVVPLVAVKAAHALLSFGLSHDWTFERDFKKYNPTATVHCYDHTVSLWSAFQYSIGQLLRSTLLFSPSALRKALTWLDYASFFRTEATHFKQRIWRDHASNSATIDDAFNRLPVECPVFVKMDIEGSEYHVLDDLLRHSNHIVAMAIEFHDLDAVSGLFNSFIEKIKRDFYIVHIHGNNLGGMTSFNFPNAPEITFLSKRFFTSAPPPSDLKYPVPGLDRPNHPRFPDFTFEF